MKKILVMVALLAVSAVMEPVPVVISQTEQELLKFFKECNQGVERIYEVRLNRN
jgi:hypothetical protein